MDDFFINTFKFTSDCLNKFLERDLDFGMPPVSSQDVVGRY